jgi:hypothetical protein
MARKPAGQTNISNSPPASRSGQSASGSEDMISEPLSRVEDTVNLNSLREEISEVKELARTLMSAVQEARAQAARADSVRGALEDVKADVRAASQAIMSAPQGLSAPLSRVPAAAAHYDNQADAGCGPCECVSSACCCFDIMLWQVRGTRGQIEPLDSGEVGPLSFPLEVQMYFSVDGIGFLWPSLGSTVDLKVDTFPIQKPGPWVELRRPVNRICLPKGSSLTKTLRVSAREEDAMAERLLGFKDEFGEAWGSITLDCCLKTIYPPQTITVELDSLGNGGGQIEVAYYAERVCC